jgi:glycogen synthase
VRYSPRWMTERSLQSDPASSDHVPGAAPLVDAVGAARPPMGPMLFEVSTEVCNQVGGIYQVLRSKAPLMTQRWGDRYIMVGPWEPSKANVEFEEVRHTGWTGRAIDKVREQGLNVHYGRWLIPGRPRVMLLEYALPPERLAAAKYRLWEEHGIETPFHDPLIDMVVGFAEACGRLFEALCDQRPSGKSGPALLAHFHEWLGGLAIPMLRRKQLPIATVFTTHATLLGRYIASSRDDFYDQLPWIDDAAEARAFNVRTQHAIERACAHGAHVFTTVSSVTAEECARLLGRPIDVVTPNGLTIGLYNAGHEQQRLHGEYKESIHRFTMGHFFPSYSFDLEKTIYMFTSGRFEPRNKGFDLCLESMARLNAELKAANLGKTVVFFIISKRPTRSINPLAMEKRGVLNELNDICQRILSAVGPRLFTRAASRGKLQLDDLVDEYWQLRYRRAQHAFRQDCLPMVVTHLLEDDRTDPVLNQIRQLDLINREDDPVKVVYHPDFINPHNRLWGLEYDQFVRGCHLGLFPSQYEPWGYTPLECAAMGVPSVSSDLAGFGRYVLDNYTDPEKFGMKILRRRGRAYQDSAADMTRYLFDFCRLERRDRIALRNEVDKRSFDFDWSRLGRAYHAAHDLAIARGQSDAAVTIGGVPMVPASALAPGPRAEGGGAAG